MWGPPVGLSGTLRRVARATEDGAVADVEGRAACGERHDVVDGQITGGVGGTIEAGARVAVLATPRPKHAGTETLPCPRAVQGVVPAAVGRSGVLGAAVTREAGDDATDGAELHPRIVGPVGLSVYSPRVLRLRDQGTSASPTCRRDACEKTPSTWEILARCRIRQSRAPSIRAGPRTGRSGPRARSRCRCPGPRSPSRSGRTNRPTNPRRA